MSTVTLHLGDCLDVLPTLTAVDCVITDPPYTEETQRGGRTRNDDVFSGDNLVPFSITYDDLKLRFDAAGQICRTWFVASTAWQHGALLEQAPPATLEFVRAGVWVKTNSAPQFTGDRPSQGWEFVAIMHKQGTVKKWNGGGRRAVWQTAVEPRNGHPTPKPLSLITQWVTEFTNPGGTVLDPFMGSGTTGVACMKLGRNFIGIEKEPRYFNVAQRRIATAQAQLVMPLFGVPA